MRQPDHTVRFCRQVICAVVVLTAAAGRCDAANRIRELADRVGMTILAEGTSDGDVRDFSRSRIPLHKMSSRSRQRANAILEHTSQFRRMPTLQYAVDRGMYQYLINHPDVAVASWRAMGISQLQLHQTGKFEYEASAPDGSDGIADVLWRDGSQCLFIVQGQYRSPLLPASIQASALVWLQYKFVNAPDGSLLVNQQIETFIYFPSGTVDVIAKMATRVTNAILDRNVFEVSLYARMMSQAVQKDPQWLEQLANRLDGVLPERQKELVEIARSRAVNTPPPAAFVSLVDPTDPQQLRLAGEFRTFEHSMQQLNTYLPLVPAQPVSQSSAGRTNEPQALPMAQQRSPQVTLPLPNRSSRIRYFGASGRGTQSSAATTPGSEPRHSGRSVPPLVFATPVAASREFEKAGSDQKPSASSMRVTGPQESGRTGSRDTVTEPEQSRRQEQSQSDKAQSAVPLPGKKAPVDGEQ